MPQQRFDMGSKWLLHNQGKGALRVGGFKGVRRIETLPGEIVQNRKYPDGLIRVYFTGDPKPHHVLIEVATYPERRALKQALDDLAVAYTELGHLPELLMLVLRPKGKFRIDGHHEVRSKLGLSSLQASWKPVELWTLSAAEFLAEGDVGAVPWITLMQFDGPPEGLLERCAEKIEREAPPKDQADLLAVAQVMTGLRFPNPELLRLFGGQTAMLESPLLQKMMAERSHDLILAVLKDRFGTVALDLRKLLKSIFDEKKLKKLVVFAGKCPDLQAFREELLA